MTKLEALRNQKLLLFNLSGNLLDQVYAAMEEYAQSLLSEKESLIVELTNKVVEQDKEIERLRIQVASYMLLQSGL